MKRNQAYVILRAAQNDMAGEWPEDNDDHF